MLHCNIRAAYQNVAHSAGIAHISFKRLRRPTLPAQRGDETQQLWRFIYATALQQQCLHVVLHLNNPQEYSDDKHSREGAHFSAVPRELP
jgi:hypothetical protein